MELTPRQKRRAVIRWLWIPICVILMWYAMLVVGMALHSLATKFCPADALISGFCTASWFPAVERAIIVGCAGLAGFGIVLVSAITAPRLRVRAAAVVYAVGVVVALNMVVETHAYSEFAAALVGGLLGVLAAWRLPQSIEL